MARPSDSLKTQRAEHSQDRWRYLTQVPRIESTPSSWCRSSQTCVSKAIRRNVLWYIKLRGRKLMPSCIRVLRDHFVIDDPLEWRHDQWLCNTLDPYLLKNTCPPLYSLRDSLPPQTLPLTSSRASHVIHSSPFHPISFHPIPFHSIDTARITSTPTQPFDILQHTRSYCDDLRASIFGKVWHDHSCARFETIINATSISGVWPMPFHTSSSPITPSSPGSILCSS